ncbi:MAG: hypothetical protein ACYTDT_04795 [Planctomycetota bacterium]
MATPLQPAWQEHQRLIQAIPKSVRESVSAVPIPRAVALRIAHETLSRWPLKEVPKILDPSCGCGGILLATLEWAMSQRPTWVSGLLSGRLQGWDILREHTQASGRVLNIAAQSLGQSARIPIHTRDALDTDDTELTDVVLCAPPLKDLKGAHARDLDPAKRARYARRFGGFTSKPAIHTAFAEQAGRLIRRPNGRIGVVLPISVADDDECMAFRKAMARLVNVEGMLPQRELSKHESAALFLLSSGKGDVSGNPWQAREDEGVFNAGRMRHPTLPDGTFRDCGVNLGNSASQLISTQKGAGLAPVRDGSDLIAFAIRAPRLWMHQGTRDTGRYAKIPPKTLFGQVRLVMQANARRPIVAPHHPPAYFLNDIIGVVPPKGVDPYYLMGVLNSEFVARLYRNSFRDARLRESDRMDVKQLNALPVPSPRRIGKAGVQIAQLAKALFECGGRNAKMLAQLNGIVERIY